MLSFLFLFSFFFPLFCFYRPILSLFFVQFLFFSSSWLFSVYFPMITFLILRLCYFSLQAAIPIHCSFLGISPRPNFVSPPSPHRLFCLPSYLSDRALLCSSAALSVLMTSGTSAGPVNRDCVCVFELGGIAVCTVLWKITTLLCSD